MISRGIHDFIDGFDRFGPPPPDPLAYGRRVSSSNEPLGGDAAQWIVDGPTVEVDAGRTVLEAARVG
ncbi:MAG: hypothetical protein RBT60_14505 [Candidatus Krumholzibacteria bacterium]|nr:hypothetical protein [Candidatus Krumholzibacteria bacterium]MDY0111135.1 hypothetical protein [Candidatus Krumholzibacteria bacterium]